jgi:GTP-binding protein HflX
MLPRLTKYWSHLSRQEGGIGIGLRGPGETQLEVDRRNIKKRIRKLSDTLETFEKRRITRSKKRKDIFKTAIIGYTNTGKSTLLNAITNANVLVEDKLFATLDTTTRKVKFKNQFDILLSDTVGFIKKLPHHLIASFKSTLGEARDADLLLHIVDITSLKFREQIFYVNDVLQSLNILDKPTLIVFNKLDILKDDNVISDEITIPFSNFKYIEKLKRIAKILSTTFENDHITVCYKTKRENLGKIKTMIQN